jgi:hypothetical protein
MRRDQGLWLVFVGFIVVASTACGGVESGAVVTNADSVHRTTGAAASSELTPCTNDATWATTRGDSLRAMKAQAPTLDGQVPVDAGDWAYPSVAVDIPEDGTYTFDFGPLASDFNYPKSPSGGSFDFPLDFKGRLSALGDARIVTRDTQRFFEVTFRVDMLAAPCAGLTLWFY